MAITFSRHPPPCWRASWPSFGRLCRARDGERVAGPCQLMWPQQLGRMPHHRALAVLEYRERLRDFGDRLFRRLRSDEHDIGGIANGESVVLQIEQPRGHVGQHAEALA